MIIVAGAVSLGVRGLNLGIDFKGGTQITFKTHKAYTTDEIRKIAAAPDVDRPDAVVQGRGTSVNGDVHDVAGAHARRSRGASRTPSSTT